MKQQKKLLLIELGSSHSELFYSQILFCKKSGYEISLLCNTNKWEKYILESFDKVYHFEVSDEVFTNYFLRAKQMRNIILEDGFDFVVFNTIIGNFIRFLSLFKYPSHIQFFGIAHTKKNFDASSHKPITRWIKNYFVLSDYILDYPINDKSLRFASFYPIFFPPFLSITLPETKTLNDIWIAVPGGIAIIYKEKPYQKFFDLLLDADIPKHIKFVIIGRYYENKKSVLAKLKAIQERNHSVIFFEEHLSDALFHQYIKDCDIVMPLIHEGIHCQISGGFSLAYAYQKPLLCHEQLQKYSEFQENAIFHNDENFISVLQEIADGEILQKMQQKIYQNECWKFATQCKCYIDFLNNS